MVSSFACTPQYSPERLTIPRGPEALICWGRFVIHEAYHIDVWGPPSRFIRLRWRKIITLLRATDELDCCIDHFRLALPDLEPSGWRFAAWSQGFGLWKGSVPRGDFPGFMSHG